MYTMFGSADWFLVCGLGNLGQHCVVALKEFEVGLIGIEQVHPQQWEIANIPDLLDDLIWGDFRQKDVLEQAKIGQCRAALILTSNEQVNIEAALAIRQLNPYIRLVIRSAKGTLNQLLSKQLGNFIAYDPTELPAAAFALAALGKTTLGLFTLDRQKLQIVQCQAGKSFLRNKLRYLHELNNPTRQLLAAAPNFDDLPSSFHQWEQDELLQLGDWLVYIELVDDLHISQQQFDLPVQHRVILPEIKRNKAKWHRIPARWGQVWQQQLATFWQLGFQSQVRRVAILYGITVLVLLLVGTLLFQRYYPNINFGAAFFDTAILLLGGYGDLFGNFQQSEPIPWWLRLFALGLTITGTAFVGVLYAILTEALLSSKFEFIKHRPPTPQHNHIVVIGMGRIGQRVATLLQDLQQSLVGMTLGGDVAATFLPHLPLVTSNLSTALRQANCATAKSVVVVTADEILNLEIALMAQSINPASQIVLRTAGQRLSELLPRLLPQAQILSVYTVVAEAFAGAAFGENIINLFRFKNQTILVTEYQIEAIDTLNGLSIADVAYGYETMPIFHRTADRPGTFFPPDEIRLAVGDRLVVLATIDGLRRIEQGKLSIKPKSWRLRVESALTKYAAYLGTNAIARVSGYPEETVRDWLTALPVQLPILLYKHQGQRLVRELSQMQVRACLIPTMVET